jgi:hypothetical protein
MSIRGSERHIRWYANEGRRCLDAAIFTALPSLASAATDGELEWLCPCPPSFEELRNERFIEALGLDDRLDAFRAFWPFSGKGTPNWDAVARAQFGSGHGAVLVEAKAHLAEFDKRDDKSGARDPGSQAMIDRGLQAARKFYGVSPTAPDWRHSYYQVSNRLTHLSWMCAKADMPTWLVWVFIVDDPDWPIAKRLSAPIARRTFDRVLAEIGLPRLHPLSDRIAAVFLPPAPPAALQVSGEEPPSMRP